MALTKSEARILRSIVVASENDPRRPEFPPDNPKFPATPTYRITVPGFSNVWLKDESVNPTGTHKDRMAWEIVVTYRDLLLAKKRGQMKGRLPQMSIISSGSAALAIQTVLRRYGLPRLKVLADSAMNQAARSAMEGVGCEVYQVDLGIKAFAWKEILALTQNQGGFDITSTQALDPYTRFYDWLSYEIINSSPEYCLLPFGTGNLYENVLYITKLETSSAKHDPRFRGRVETLRRCNFLGATSNNPRTKAEKLYSPHLPFVHYDEQSIRLYKYAGYIGPASNIHVVIEQRLEEAMQIARAQGIRCEYSGIAGLALLLQERSGVPKKAKILIVNTGRASYPDRPDMAAG